MTATECVLVVDFGGQYTHLISRRCRELGVFAKIIHQDKALTGEDLQGVKGMILSGGPRSIEDSDLGAPFDANMEQLHENQIPALGICFGHQLLAVWKGARLSPGGNPEYGKTELQLLKKESILADLEDGQQVWMSHSDEVAELSQDLEPLAMSGEARIAAFRSKDGFFFGVQFHPEVTHTPNGITILQRF
ncbi:MAG: glutamine-hydrolyzing GMP synthase, partial [Promethearchaeia archaeon]